ncbi:transposase [Mesorhizobium australicum]
MPIKRLTDGCFAWPTTKDQVAVSLTKAQLSLLLDGIDWRRPSKIYRPVWLADFDVLIDFVLILLP